MLDFEIQRKPGCFVIETKSSGDWFYISGTLYFINTGWLFLDDAFFLPAILKNKIKFSLKPDDD